MKLNKKGDHRLHSIWGQMHTRCKNKKNDKYKYYGGKGIIVCSRWYSFECFLADMESSFHEGLTLDRIDNDSSYSPENCRWATRKEQCNNRSSNVLVEYEGQLVNLAQLADITGINKGTILTRRSRGATTAEQLTRKIRSRLSSV